LPGNCKGGSKLTTKKKPAVPFAENIAQLEKIIANMEAGQLSLEEMLKHYSEGVQLLISCREQLLQAEGKVEELNKQLAGDNNA